MFGISEVVDHACMIDSNAYMQVIIINNNNIPVSSLFFRLSKQILSLHLIYVQARMLIIMVKWYAEVVALNCLAL